MWEVGVFVAVGLVILVVIVFAIRDWRIFRSGYEIRVLVDSASGLLVGAPVKFAGVEVGEVKAIRIIRDHPSASDRVELTLWLPKGLEVRRDDRVAIGMLGLLGEKYVEILPGPGSGEVLKPGEALTSTEILSELELTQKLNRLLIRLERVLAAADTLARNPETLQHIESALERTEHLTERLDQAIETAEALMREWQAVGEKSRLMLDEMRHWGPLVLLGVGAVLLLPLLIALIS